MDLKEAVAVAKQQIGELFAADAPQNVRLEEFAYDDHLGVWTLTIGFALSAQARNYKRFQRATNPFFRSGTDSEKHISEVSPELRGGAGAALGLQQIDPVTDPGERFGAAIR
jgi:hypothetical protein